METSVLWLCPYCNRYNNRVFRFKGQEPISNKELVMRKRKVYYSCRFCNKKSRLHAIKEQKTVDVSIGTRSGELNAIKIKRKLGVIE